MQTNNLATRSCQTGYEERERKLPQQTGKLNMENAWLRECATRKDHTWASEITYLSHHETSSSDCTSKVESTHSSKAQCVKDFMAQRFQGPPDARLGTKTHIMPQVTVLSEYPARSDGWLNPDIARQPTKMSTDQTQGTTHFSRNSFFGRHWLSMFSYTIHSGQGPV